MAYAEKGLRRLTHRGAVGNGDGSVTSNWAYDTNDNAATVEAANYFNAAASVLSKGDVIEAVMVRSGTPVGKTFIVTANTGSAVTIAVFTAAAA